MSLTKYLGSSVQLSKLNGPTRWVLIDFEQTPPNKTPLILLVMVICLFVASFAHAATPGQMKALGAVGVAKAAVEVADRKAVLPSTPTAAEWGLLQDLEAAEAKSDEIEAQAKASQEEAATLKKQNETLRVAQTRIANEAESELSRMAHEIELLRSAPPPAQAKPPQVFASIAPMKLEFTPPVAAAGAARRRVVTVYTGEAFHGKRWCLKCGPTKEKFGSGDESTEIRYSDKLAPDGMQRYPAFRFDLNGVSQYTSKPLTDAQGRVTMEYHIPDDMAELNSILDNCGIVSTQSYEATGFAGTLHARSHIEAAIAGWKEQIGPGAKIKWRWLRTGGQTFPIIHQKPEQWNFKAIAGDLGEFIIEAQGSKLPVELIMLGYRRDGESLKLRGEVAIPVAQLGLPGDTTGQQTVYGAEPAGFGPMTLLTIFSIGQTVFAALHPTCDLTLGGTVSATAFYDEQRNAIQIDFQDMPSIKLVWLWQFNLAIKQLVISPTNVHAEFSGSRVVHSRDIAVQ